jgi:hypothetical protein
MGDPYRPSTPEQDRLHELYRRSSEVRDFLDEQYPRWRRDPQAAFEALAELQEMGAEK